MTQAREIFLALFSSLAFSVEKGFAFIVLKASTRFATGIDQVLFPFEIKQTSSFLTCGC